MHINGSGENQAPIGPGSSRTTVFISVQGQRLWGWKGPEEHLVHQPPSSYRLENCPRRAVTCLRPHTEQYPAAIIIWSQPIPPGSGPGGRTPGANPPPRSAPGRSPAERGMEEFPHGLVPHGLHYCLPVGCSCARPPTGLTFLCPLIKLQEPSPQPTIAHHTMCHVLFQPST